MNYFLAGNKTSSSLNNRLVQLKKVKFSSKHKTVQFRAQKKFNWFII